jgi:four helix bundle protein
VTLIGRHRFTLNPSLIPAPFMIRSYRDLHVWQLGIRLVIESYKVGQQLPLDERFGVTAQIRRAAVSVPTNIAEGHGRSSRGDYRHHVWIAAGSLRELETLFEIVAELRYLNGDSLKELRGLCDELGRMLTRLAKRLESPPPRRSLQPPDP